FVPEGWRDAALAEKWVRVRELRALITAELEKARAAGRIGSSLQAKPTLFAPGDDQRLLTPDQWAEVCIVSDFMLLETRAEVPLSDAEATGPKAAFHPAPGIKCDRCWRVLPEVGLSAAHPTLCRRCETVVERQ
ncbi:MAG: zinc finger domain-containing protein, partial [Paracraurococcus sp.]